MCLHEHGIRKTMQILLPQNLVVPRLGPHLYSYPATLKCQGSVPYQFRTPGDFTPSLRTFNFGIKRKFMIEIQYMERRKDEVRKGAFAWHEGQTRHMTDLITVERYGSQDLQRVSPETRG